MNAVEKAQKEIAKLEGRRDDLSARLLAAKGEQDQLVAERGRLEQLAYGRDDPAAEAKLAHVARALERNAARQRGIGAEHLETVQALQKAQERRREAQLALDTAEAQHLSEEIAKTQFRLAALVAERAALLQRRQVLVLGERREERLEGEAVEKARELIAASSKEAGR
jgi:hypothetical protein